MAANPDAIAWYVQRSEGLLADLRERVQSQRARGGQLAGFSGAVLALAGANAVPILTVLHGVAQGCAGASLLVGSLFLICASVSALRGASVPRVVSDLSAEEVANYATKRFVEEPDLWRVQLRSIRGLRRSIDLVIGLSDRAARSISRAEHFFFAGLSLVGMTLAILVLMEVAR
jgi:hypothetical protein